MAMFLCGMMCLFLGQASFYPALGQGSDNASEDRIGNVKIVVKRGETLWGLAQIHQTTVDEIVKLNKVKRPDHIREGESLWVPNRVVEEKPKKIEDTIMSDYSGSMLTEKEAVNKTVNSSWWVNALRGNAVQVGSSSLRPSTIQPQEQKIITYEIFVNPKNPDPETPDISEPPSIKTLPNDIDTVQKEAVLKTASKGGGNQILSRSLGRLVSTEEVELLTRVIHGEARGENFEGQVAVGAVVLNRLKDPRFPKTIHSVVYQSGAFTAVNDKQIHLNPNDESYKAAEAALSGLDPSNGALFYFNPHLATDGWIKTRPVVKRIGNHTFSI